MVEEDLTEVVLFGPSEVLFLRSVLGFGQSGIRISTGAIDTPEDVDAALDSFRPDVIATVDGIDGFDALPIMSLIRNRNTVLPIFVVADRPAPGRVLRLIRAGADEVFCFSEGDRLARFLSGIGRSQIREREGTRLLRNRLSRFSPAIPENLFDSVILISPEGRCRDINAAGTEWLGLCRQDIGGRKIFDCMNSRAAERWRAYVARAIETKSQVEVEEDGSGNWLRGRLIPFTDRDGEVDEILLIAADVTGVKQRQWIEENLQQSEERYRTLFEQSPDAIVVHRNWTILYANDAAAFFFWTHRCKPGHRPGLACLYFYGT